MADISEVRAGSPGTHLHPGESAGARPGPRRILALVTAIVFTAGLSVFVQVPGGGTTPTKSFTDFYSSSGKRLAAFLFTLVMVAGCLLLMWLFTEIRSRLADSMPARLGHTFAIVGAALLLAGTCIVIGASGVQNFTGQPFVGVNVAGAVHQAGGSLAILGGIYPLAVAIFLLSLAARRERAALPGWLATTGLVLAVLLIGSIIASPAVLLPIWILLVAVGGLRPGATG